jgi:hypothetical protein
MFEANEAGKKYALPTKSIALINSKCKKGMICFLFENDGGWGENLSRSFIHMGIKIYL